MREWDDSEMRAPGLPSEAGGSPPSAGVAGSAIEAVKRSEAPSSRANCEAIREQEARNVATHDTAPSDLRPRSCGTCAACCTYLGITALRKFPNQVCKHLDGRNPTHRCTIYASRPEACSMFKCGWLLNLGTDLMRPDLSGVLVSLYAPEHGDGERMSATLTILDFDRAGTVAEGNLFLLIQELLNNNFDDIRIVNYGDKGVVHLYKSEIRRGRIQAPLKDDPNRYESLTFETYDPPIGKYERKEPESC